MKFDNSSKLHIRLRGDRIISALKQIQARKKKMGISMSLTQLANQAIALGLKVANEHAP